MKKFKKKVKVNESKFVDFVDGLIEGTLNGDWSEYEEGEEVRYKYDFNDKDYLEMLEENNIEFNEVKEFIGEGICYIVDENIWYNISIKDNIVLVDWVNDTSFDY